MCQCRFTGCNKCTSLVGDVDNGEGYAHVGAKGMWEISVPGPQFWWDLKLPLEKAMAPHSSTLAWRIPGTGEPAGLPSMGSHRVGHD